MSDKRIFLTPYDGIHEVPWLEMPEPSPKDVMAFRVENDVLYAELRDGTVIRCDPEREA